MAAAALAASLSLVLAASAVTDLRSRLIPDAFLAPAAAFAVLVTAAAEPHLLGERLGWGAAAGAFLLCAALARPGGMGLGDVKLGVVMGLHLGAAVAAALCAGMASGAVVGALAALGRGIPVAAATVPLAPHLAAGTAAVAVTRLV